MWTEVALCCYTRGPGAPWEGRSPPPAAGSVLALAEKEPFSSVQIGTFICSPGLCFSPGLSGELLELQVCKLIRQ